MAKKKDSNASPKPKGDQASSADDKATQVRNERMLSQIENMQKALAGSSGNAKPFTKPTKRRGRGLSESDFLTGNDSSEKEKPMTAGRYRRESKASSAASRQRNADLQDIIYDYDLRDHPERDAIAQEIYNTQQGISDTTDDSEEAQVAREIGDTEGIETPQGLPGRYDESIGDTEAEDLEPGQRSAGIIESAMGTGFGSANVSLEGGSSSSKDEPARRRPSRNTELALGMGRPRGPMEADPNDYWTGREAPTSVEHAQALLEASMRDQALWRDPKNDPRDLVNFGSADPDLPRSSVAEGTESVGKVNKPIREENKMRLYVARLEDAIKTGKFGPTTGGTRGTKVIPEVGAVPIQRLPQEEGGLDEKTKDLLLSNQSGAILRRGEDAGVSRAVKGTFDIPAQVRVQVPAVADTQARDKDGNLLTNKDGTPKMQGAQPARIIRTTRDVADRILARTEGATELDPEHGMVQGPNGEVSSRERALELRENPETGETELANPLQNVLPTITDANGVTRPNPAYPVRSEKGVPLQKTEEEENAYRMQLGDQLVSKSSGKERPLSLTYIKGEGRKRYRKRQVRADYKGPVLQETVAGIGPVYGAIRANLAGGQFDQGTGQTTDPNTGRRINIGEGTEAGDITETMIQIGGSEDVKNAQIAEVSQTSDLRDETPAGNLDRARRGRLQSLNTGKNVPVLIAYDKDGKPLTNKRVDTVVGATSSVQSERGSKERRRVSIEDTANMFGGPALTDTVPVMVKDDKGKPTDVPLENKDYKPESPRRIVTTERTRQPYDILKRIVNPVTKKREAYRVSDMNAETAGRSRTSSRMRILRLNQMMNRGLTNQPAPGADPTVRSSIGTGSEFLRENSMNPIYDPEFAARVGTPEEVRARGIPTRAPKFTSAPTLLSPQWQKFGEEAAAKRKTEATTREANRAGLLEDAAPKKVTKAQLAPSLTPGAPAPKAPKAGAKSRTETEAGYDTIDFALSHAALATGNYPVLNRDGNFTDSDGEHTFKRAPVMDSGKAHELISSMYGADIDQITADQTQQFLPHHKWGGEEPGYVPSNRLGFTSRSAPTFDRNTGNWSQTITEHTTNPYFEGRGMGFGLEAKDVGSSTHFSRIAGSSSGTAQFSPEGAPLRNAAAEAEQRANNARRADQLIAERRARLNVQPEKPKGARTARNAQKANRKVMAANATQQPATTTPTTGGVVNGAQFTTPDQPTNL